ncbi:MAG: hypothetical protein E7662_12970 [Ruminococcaceae bacterium]|nr:hypothetical protein [Oscillospiraceae bacterium]
MRTFIFGTDWWTDCDDAVALRMLARAHNAGEIRLAGIIINACMEDSVRSLDAFLAMEKCRGIPLGLDKEAADFGGKPKYQQRLAASGASCKSNDDAEDALRLYRRLLSDADSPLELIEVGYPQAIAALLESGGDDISPKSGMELVREKAAKVWCMAGKWDDNPGRENNFARNARSRAGGAILCEKCPVPITFLGWEIGFDVLSGGKLTDGDPLKQVLADHGSPNGRCSWDPMTALMAIIGDEDAAGYSTVRGTARVDALSGENTFIPCSDGLHAYVTRKFGTDFYRDAIDARIETK